MKLDIEVKFESMAKDASIEASAHRWMALLEAAGIAIRGAFLTLEPGQRSVMVCLKLDLVDGSTLTVITWRNDIQAAVADAFHVAQRQELKRTASGGRSKHAMELGGALASA